MEKRAAGSSAVTFSIGSEPSIIGIEIECGYLERLTLFIDYTKGDEDGLFIVPYALIEKDGDSWQFQTWDDSGDLRTMTESKFSLTASGRHMIVFDVSGIEFIKFMQDADGGTPTGTIKAFYVVTGN